MVSSAPVEPGPARGDHAVLEPLIIDSHQCSIPSDSSRGGGVRSPERRWWSSAPDRPSRDPIGAVLGSSATGAAAMSAPTDASRCGAATGGCTAGRRDVPEPARRMPPFRIERWTCLVRGGRKAAGESGRVRTTRLYSTHSRLKKAPVKTSGDLWTRDRACRHRLVSRRCRTIETPLIVRRPARTPLIASTGCLTGN